VKLRLVPALLLAGILAACSSAPSHYYVLSDYVLSAQPQAARPVPKGPARTTVAIGAVKLPGALDRPQMVRRIGPNQLDYSETERWAGPLDEMVRRVLAADLRSRLAAVGFVLVGNDSAAPANLAIAVDITRFDADKAGQVTLEAGWEKLRRNGAVVDAPGNATIVEPGQGADAAAVAATMSRAIAGLAARIAAGIGGAAPAAMR
jgi:hypothetical protein